MALLIIISLAVCWSVLAILAAGVCRAARRGDADLEAEPLTAKPRWFAERDRPQILTLR